MAIETVSLGKMRQEGWAFGVTEGARYYLPKGDYTVLASGSGEGSFMSSEGYSYNSPSGRFMIERWGIEWVEFTGKILQVAIIPGRVGGKAPSTTPPTS